MATRTLSRRALRAQHDQVEQTGQSEPAVPGTTEQPEEKVKNPRARKPAAAKPAKDKTPPKPRVRKKAAKVPPRMFARWAVHDNGMKRVAVFDYRDRAGADAKLAEMLERKAGGYFLQLVKDPFDPPTPDAAEVVAAV